VSARKYKGTWWVDFYFGGKRIRRKSPINTKRGAEEHEQRLFQRLREGLPIDEESAPVTAMPLFKTFAEEFMSSYVKANNKKSTQQEKRCIFDHHLLPAFGERPLDEVRERDIEMFKATLVDKGLSAKRQKNILAVLSRMLRYAREVAVLTTAPLIRMPKVPPTTMDFLSDHDFARLCTAAEATPGRLAMVLIAGEAGLRKGELLALEWDDLDLGIGTSSITVMRSVWHDNESGEHVGSPKSGRLRKVPMTDRLRRALLAHRSLRGKRVFCKDDGSGLTPGQLEVALRNTCTRARMRQIGWHVLRHTFGSHLAQRGASPKAIQELMGHSDFVTTMRYMHLAPAHHREAIGLLESGLSLRSTVAPLTLWAPAPGTSPPHHS
jgi:integrase